MNRILNWLPVVLGVTLLSALVSFQWHRVLRGQTDFVSYYVGGKLAGTPELYSRPANEAMIRQTIGTSMEAVTFTRPPYYAFVLKPFSWLPYLPAYAIFCLLCLLSILWFVIRFARDCPSLPLFASLNIALAAFLAQGQDTPILLSLTALPILALRKNRDVAAGLLLSLCTIKFHLFVLVPLLLLMKKKWRMFAGATAGTVFLILAGLALEGIEGHRMYFHILRDPWINFSVDVMPNLHGLVTSLHGGAGVELALAAAVVAAFLWICSRSDDFEMLYGLSLLCSLLISYHSGISDHMLLLLAFALTVNAQVDKSVRIAYALAISPIPYFLGISLGIVLPVCLLAVLILIAFSVSRLAPQRSIQPAVAA